MSSSCNFPARVRDSLDKAGLSFVQAMLMSAADLRKKANLTKEDVEAVKMHCAEELVATKFLRELKYHFLTTGCKVLDEELGGGFARRGITEVSGESGAGKTQLCLQAALSVQLSQSSGGAGAGAVYICTEDTFPSARLQQLLHLWPSIHAKTIAVKFSDNIFIEHIPDAESLKNCISVRLPNLLRQRKIGLVVVDSIAGPFRADYDLRQGAVTRAQVLKSIGQELHMLANIHNLTVICVNQVTAVAGENKSLSVPALGLAWANLVTTRLQLHRSDRMLANHDGSKAHIAERLLEVVFSPYLATKRVPFVVTETGVQGLSKQTI
ncbi:DNA repair protein Rad51 homolog [Gryllus bimaculatus]|nr:DNA repair protein Rad51 homolog [Gryllus bimaculatus]